MRRPLERRKMPKTTLQTRDNLNARRKATEDKIHLLLIWLFAIFVVLSSIYLAITYG